MSYKVDLHTHTTASPDGSLRAEHYRRMLQSRRLDFVAVTDHNTTDMACTLHAEFGDRIIIGEEITALEGEIIGLYLHETVPAGLPALTTAERIHAQGGLVYVPHPFETVRKGLPADVLEKIAKHVDIIETHNGRAVFQNRTNEAVAWAAQHGVPGAAGSDAHGRAGWGRTYTVLSATPTSDNLLQLLSTATNHYASPGVHGLLYPKINRAKARLYTAQRSARRRSGV